MKFNLEITIMDPKSFNRKKLYLAASFAKMENTYGNGMYLSIKGRGETKFEQLFDVRYIDIDPNNLEVFIAKWAYSYWSGTNGAWDIVKFSIENVKASNKGLKPDVILY